MGIFDIYTTIFSVRVKNFQVPPIFQQGLKLLGFGKQKSIRKTILIHSGLHKFLSSDKGTSIIPNFPGITAPSQRKPRKLKNQRIKRIKLFDLLNSGKGASIIPNFPGINGCQYPWLPHPTQGLLSFALTTFFKSSHLLSWGWNGPSSAQAGIGLHFILLVPKWWARNG